MTERESMPNESAARSIHWRTLDLLRKHVGSDVDLVIDPQEYLGFKKIILSSKQKTSICPPAEESTSTTFELTHVDEKTFPELAKEIEKPERKCQVAIQTDLDESGYHLTLEIKQGRDRQIVTDPQKAENIANSLTQKLYATYESVLGPLRSGSTLILDTDFLKIPEIVSNAFNQKEKRENLQIQERLKELINTLDQIKLVETLAFLVRESNGSLQAQISAFPQDGFPERIDLTQKYPVEVGKNLPIGELTEEYRNFKGEDTELRTCLTFIANLQSNQRLLAIVFIDPPSLHEEIGFKYQSQKGKSRWETKKAVWFGIPHAGLTASQEKNQKLQKKFLSKLHQVLPFSLTGTFNEDQVVKKLD